MVVHLITGPVLDLAAFCRTAHAVARSRLPHGPAHWAVAVDPGYAEPRGVEAALRSFGGCFYWSMTELVRCEREPEGYAWEFARDREPDGTACQILIASDAVFDPDVLPTVVDEVGRNPANNVVVPGRSIAPDALLAMDAYGSNFPLDRVRWTPHAHTLPAGAAVVGWDAEAGWLGDDPVESARVAYVQLDRAGYPGWNRLRYVAARTTSGGGA